MRPFATMFGIIALTALLCGTAWGQTKTWTATGSGNWSTGSNWSGGTIPTASDSVDLSGLAANIVITIDADAVCGVLNMGASQAATGTILQFPTTGSITLTITTSGGRSGKLNLAGGSGNNTQGTRPKLTSNGNVNAKLVIEGDIFTSVSNSTANGSPGLNMNEGYVTLAGSATCTFNPSAGFRLGNFQIGDGTNSKVFNWVPTAAGTMLVLSLTVKQNCTFNIGSTGVTTTNGIGGTPALTGGFTIESGASVIVQNASSGTNSNNITIAGGNLTNNGTLSLISANGSRKMNVVFSGSSGQSIEGSGSFSLNKVTINNSAGVSLGASITVNDTLTLTNGNITTGSNTLTLGSSATLVGETAGRYVIGNLATTRTVGTGSSTFGGIGVSLDAGADDLGSVTVTRVSGSSGAVTVSGKTGIKRKWTITSTNPPSSGRNLTLSWVSDDDNSKDLTTAQIWRSTDGGTTWQTVGAPQDASSTRSVTASVTSFSDYTVSDGANPLPVQLTSFTATANRLDAVLQWSTATETKNYGFEIERRKVAELTTDAHRDDPENAWKKVGFVAGAGTSTSPRQYSYVDRNVAPGRYAYRIKQIDNDGSFAYYSAAEVEIGLAAKEFKLESNYPNPFNPETTLEFTLAEDGRASLKVYNVLGQEVATLFDAQASAGRVYQAKFDGRSLPSGVYYSVLTHGGRQQVRKLLLMK